MRFFQGQNVVAFISDRTVDFQPEDFDAPLSQEQRAYIQSICGVEVPQVFWRKQVHGDDVLVAKDRASLSRGCPDADAYITAVKNLPIAIRTADCVPVFLLDAQKGAIGLAHAGWKGTFKEITYKTVLRMQEAFGSDPQDIQAVLGPAIQSCCYEVQAEFRQYFPEDLVERSGKLYVDVVRNNYKQLQKAGLKREHINNTEVCTCCNLQYFSYRREGLKAGRMISLMVRL